MVSKSPLMIHRAILFMFTFLFFRQLPIFNRQHPLSHAPQPFIMANNHYPLFSSQAIWHRSCMTSCPIYESRLAVGSGT